MGLAGGVWSWMTGSRVHTNMERNKKSGVQGDLIGEGMKLGGLFVVGRPDGSGSEPKMVYLHTELQWGDHAPLEDVRKAISLCVGAADAKPISTSGATLVPGGDEQSGNAASGSAI